MISTIAPIVDFMIGSVLGGMLFVPAWILRRLIKLENVWIRPLLWIVMSALWPLLAVVGGNGIVLDLFTTSLLSSAVFFIPWTLVGFVRARKLRSMEVTNG